MGTAGRSPGPTRFRRRGRCAIVCLAVAVLAGACGAPEPGRRIATTPATPEAWRQPGRWRFEVVDAEARPLGDIVLLLTDRPLSPDPCRRAGVSPGWRQAVVIEDRLAVDVGGRKNPAYHIRGPWLTLDLTASLCHAGHRFVGNLDADGASGHFNYSHALGGRNIGRFVARPAAERP